MAKKQFARTFGQDLMRGEHVVGQGRTETASLKGGLTHGTTMHPYDGQGRQPNDGLLLPPSAADPNFYPQKREVEHRLGRELSTAEYLAEFYTPPEGSTLPASGTSIFDPVLCELAYRWFCPPGGMILDPFAGGSVRGVVAGRLGRRYVGIELRPEQVAANRAQAHIAGDGPAPDWRVGDARALAELAADVEADFVFSCPPYWNLEVYSDDPADLSTLGREEFFAAQAGIVAAAVARLKPDRFAAWVVGDVRDKDGGYVNLPGRTVEAFEAAGARFYNEAILVTAAGSLPIRAGKQFSTTRKLGKTHQQMLVFVKGDPRRATAAVGPVDFADPDADEQAAPAADPEPAPAAQRIKVSAAWLSRKHDCTLAGIHARCNGGCCYGNAFWPGKSGAREMPDGRRACDHLGPAGCVLPPADKPVTCLLYPLMINNHGTVVLHHRATFGTGVCKGNHGNGPPVVDALRDNLTELFGAEQYARVRADVLAGRDSWLDVPPAVAAARAREVIEEAENRVPTRRSLAGAPPDNTPALTPVEAFGEVWAKRDDLYRIAGVPGGKVRTCWALAQGAPGLVTAGSRASPQVNIVAHIARRLGVPCRVHTPQGELSPEVLMAQAAGAEVIQHKAGYNNVIVARAREDAQARGWREIPFGMECQEAVEQTRRQVADLPAGVRRVVVPVGSGMSLAGILWGLADAGLEIPVLGIVVGADPAKRLDKFAPPGWRDRAELRPAGMDYHAACADSLPGLSLDPHYEAKCVKHLNPGDLFWVVGVRASL